MVSNIRVEVGIDLDPSPHVDALKILLTRLLVYQQSTYLEYHSVCPLVGIGTPPSLSRQRVPPPPGTKGGRHTRLRVSERGVSIRSSEDWRKSLALCLLCAYTP
jgi:hypothetical protein